MANDSDIDGDPLTITSYTVAGNPGGIPTIGTPFLIPAVGQITINADGSYTFIPNINYYGNVPPISYAVNDGQNQPNSITSGTLVINVTAVNDAPIAVNDTGNVNEDATLVVAANNGLLANDTDVDDLVLNIVGYNVAGVVGIPTIGLPFTIPGVGNIQINANGSYQFTPLANYSGPVPAIIYTVSDGVLTSTANLAITITPINDNPIANDDVATILEDATLSANASNGLLANDTDVENDNLTIPGFTINGIVGNQTVGTPITITGIGVLTINADGSYNFVPEPNFNGNVPLITYQISDGNGGTASATFAITVTAVNDLPIATNDAISINEDETLTRDANNGLLANDSDIDNDALTITGFTIAGMSGTQVIGSEVTIIGPGGMIEGKIKINSDGSYEFTPTANFNGNLPLIAYTVSDVNGATATATLSIVIASVNDAPVASAIPLSITTPEDTAQNGLINASDADSDPLTFTLTSPPTHGTVILNPNGTYSYTPALNYNGPDSFTVTISDGNGGATVITIPIVVTAVNDTPIATAPPITTTEDTPKTGMVTASDADGDLLTYTISTPPTNGSVVVDANGNYTYTPNANFNGSDSFTITVSDGKGGNTLVNIPVTVTPINDIPLVSSPSVSTAEDSPVNGIITIVDADGDPINIVVTNQPTNGTVIVNQNGTYTYTPNLNYNGVDSFTVTVSDGNGGTTTLTIAITVTAVNDAPTATSPAISTTEDTPKAGLITIADVDLDPLTITVITQPAHGTVSVNQDGTYLYTPALNYNGADSFTVTVSDGKGGNKTLTIPITVTPVNDAPVASSPAITTAEDTPKTGTITATDVDADVLTYLVTTAPTHGTVIVNSNGTYTYTPALNYNGTDSFTVTVSDGNGGTVTVTILVTVTGVNDAPVASSPAIITAEDTPKTGTITATDADGDALTFSLITPPTNGTVVLNADGTYTYTPKPNFNGADSFTVTISDGKGGTVTVTIPVTVTAVNDLPTATATPLVTNEDTPATGKVTATDIDGDALTFTLGTPPSNGTVVVNADGTYTYTPKPNFNGTDSFTVTVSDGKGGTITVTISITVNAVNDAPVAVDNVATTNPNTAVVIPILANDIKGDSNINPASVVITQQPANGTLTINPTNGNVTYTPNAGFFGTDSFKYTVKDALGDVSNPANVTITVNRPPTAIDDSAQTEPNTAVTINVLNNDVKYGNTTIDLTSITITQQPANGTLSINSTTGVITYTPNANFAGTDSFKYTFKDSNGAISNAATATVVVADRPKIGLAKAAVSTVKTINGTYDITYLFTVANLGLSTINNVSVKDDLKQTFKGDAFRIKSIKANGALAVNPSYNGDSNTELLQTGNTLNVGKTETFEIVVNVSVKNTSYSNTAMAEGTSVSGIKISDQSTDGLKPDPEKIGDASPAVPTVVNLTIPKEFIPGGFSPNDDGVNDKFVIENSGAKRISLEVFNRWGNRVYRSLDYKNDWDGRSNEGIRIGGDVLPEGTYFYIVILDGKDKYVGNITLKR